MSDKAYVLVEGIDEIVQVEAMRAHKFPAGVVYVSLSSQAKYQLVKKGLEHVNAYDYCDLEELYRITDAQYEDLRRQCTALDELLGSQIPELRHYGINPFFFNYYQIKIILDTIAQRTFKVQGLYDAFGNRLYAFAPSVDGWARFLKTKDRMTGYILEAISRKAQILPRDRASYDFGSQETTADMRIAQELNRYRYRPLHFCKRIIKKTMKEISNFGSKGIIWSLSPFIPSESLIAVGLKRKKPELKAGSCNIPDFHLDVFNHTAFVEMVRYAGPASRPMLEAWLRVNVLDSIPGYISQARGIEALMMSDKPVLLESRTYFSPEEQLMATQFIRHGKKVLGTNHGCLGIQTEKMFGVCDLAYVSDYFVWGLGVAQYITHQYPLALDNRFNVHVSGTEHFETDVVLSRSNFCRLLGIPENKTIVLMPGSAFRNNIFYNWYSMMDEQQEYDNQIKVIDFFADRDDCIFIYKGLNNLNYDESHIRNYIADKKAEHLIYMNNTPLRSIMLAIDVFMTDRPSTSVLEAMGHGKICYSYNCWITFPGEGAALYNGAAQHFLTPEALLEKFAKDANSKFSEIPRSFDYYKAYGNAKTGLQRKAIFTDFLRNLN